MRDKERIPLMLKEIERIWEKSPDLRFNQLMDVLSYEFVEEERKENHFFDMKYKGIDLFNVEDDTYLDWLKSFSFKNDKKE